MHVQRLTARLGILAAALGVLTPGVPLRAAPPEQERNAWPVLVRQIDERGATTQWTAGGPLFFGTMAPEGGKVSGFRPFWVQRTDENGTVRAGHFLYPLFSFRQDENTFQWNVLELIRRSDRRSDAPPPKSTFEQRGDFEVWPFWFSRQTGDPELSYRALFPVAGTIKNKLGFDRATWFLFPLWTQTEKRGVVTTSVPWPIVRVTKGAAHGFGVWPLFEQRERPGRWRQEYYLWPLGYNNTTYPAADAPAGTPPTREIGALPFYARKTAPGYIDENYLWPFFGYTERRQPVAYHEARYFWPLLVQGRGDGRYVNRWGPFYTHSVVKGYDKTWYAWPVVRHATWTDRGLAMEKTQVLYFLYWSEQQRKPSRPAESGASLTHLWPLFSHWDNGNGREQFQLFSPFEVFFPGNEKVRTAWSPLVAIARYEQAAPGEIRGSLLWSAITWRRSKARQEREFHLGPVFSVASQAAERRIALGNGLVAFERAGDGHWKTLWLDFGSRRTKPSAATEPAPAAKSELPR